MRITGDSQTGPAPRDNNKHGNNKHDNNKHDKKYINIWKAGCSKQQQLKQIKTSSENKNGRENLNKKFKQLKQIKTSRANKNGSEN